jgi:hypothetical protein
MAAYQSAKQKTETAKQVKANKPGALSNQKVNSHQMVSAPETMRPEEVLAAQQQLGNQVVQRAMDDKREKRGLTDQQGNLREDISSTIQNARGSGSTLPKELQSEMQRKLGHDFTNVRLHTDEKADQLSRTISARAFTIGSDVFFKSGVYAPSSQSGRETLIHELTHVVQQSRSSSSSGQLKLGAPNTAMEKEADHKGKQGSQAAVSTSASGIQRVAEEDEVQMQEDEEEIQMQEDEEEVQMQGDEEEVQMQPDAGGVVQRNFLTDLFKKKAKPVEDPNKIPDAPEYKPAFGPVKPRGKPLSEKGQKVLQSIQSTKPAGPSEGDFRSQLINQKKRMGLSEFSSTDSKKQHAQNMENLEGEQRHRFERDTSEGVGQGKEFSRVSQRNKLVSILKDPKSTPEQMKEAEDQLRTFHKSGKFKKNVASIALDERKKMLKESARGGDAQAMAQYKKENPGLLSKLAGYAGKAQDFYGKHKDTIGTVMGVLGIGGGKKEEKAPGGGGSDGGGYAVIIGQLMQENKMLKEQLAKK